MMNTHLCVAIYLTHTQADEALSRLQIAGFGMNHLSFAGRDTWSNAVGSYATGERSKYCGPQGDFWEKLWAILAGRGVFCSDQEGPTLIAGPLVQTILTALKQEFPIEYGFKTGLSTLDIPDESVVEYDKALNNHQILLFLSGDLEEVNRARGVLYETKAINHTLHHGAGKYLSLKVTENHERPFRDDNS
jgi:hypothetical protein